MLNYIWMALLSAGMIIGVLNGRADAVSKAVLDSSRNAVELSIGLLGMLCLWNGLMSIAEKGGLVKGMAAFLDPFLSFLFPGLPRKSAARSSIVANLAANFFGLGNAATPLGLKAMAEMQRINPRKDSASDAMCMFLVLNTSAIQLIPSTLIALRHAAGSANPLSVVGPIWLSTACASIIGILSVKIISLFTLRKGMRR